MFSKSDRRRAGPARHAHESARETRSVWLILAVSAALLAVGHTSGCKTQRRPAEAMEPVRIAVVGVAKDDPTWPVIQAAARWFTERNRRAEVEVMATETASPSEQQKLLTELASRPFDAVCVAPADPVSARTAINDLVQQGKRVVTFGRDVPQSNRHAFCGPSEFEIGRAAVRACMAVLKGRLQTIILLHAGAQDEIYGDRYCAFKSELPFLGEATLLREVDCQGRWFDAAHLVRVEARRYPRVGCWVFLDDWPLRAASEKDRLLPLGCGIVLCNGSPRYFKRLRDGRILALIGFDYREAAENALFAAARSGQAAGETFSGSHNIPSEIITIRELESYENRWKQWQE